MRVKELSRSAAKVVAVGIIALAMLIQPQLVSANSTQHNPGSIVYDNFGKLYLRPDNKAYWWTNFTGLENGQFTFAQNVECAAQGCINIEHENNEKYLRILLKQHPYTGVFTISNFSELQDGTYPAQGNWNPELGKPVTFEVKARFGANMLPDGSGGAVGTTGIWLWSNPYGPTGPNFQDYHAFGFTWVEQGSIASPGFTANLVTGGFPVYTQSVQSVNLQDWNNFKVIWSTDTSNIQHLDYYVNNVNVGSTVVPMNLSNLSAKLWIDNLRVTFEGQPVYNYVAVPSDQKLDVDSLSISK
jgi:hypothetical protein